MFFKSFIDTLLHFKKHFFVLILKTNNFTAYIFWGKIKNSQSVNLISMEKSVYHFLKYKYFSEQIDLKRTYTQ